MKKQIILSILFSTFSIFGMLTPTVIHYKKNNIEFIKHIHKDGSSSFLEFITPNNKTVCLMKFQNSSETCIDHGETLLTREQCEKKFTEIEALIELEQKRKEQSKQKKMKHIKQQQTKHYLSNK